MKKPTNLRQAIQPLMILKVIIGCVIMTDEPKKYLLILNICYMIGFWMCYFVAFIQVVNIIQQAEWYSFQEGIFLIVFYTQIAFMIANLVFEVYYQRRRSNATIRWSAADETLQVLGININYYMYFVDQILTIALWFVLTAISTFIDMLWWKGKLPPLQNFAMILIIQHPMQANSFLEWCFIMSIKHIGLRYRLINRLLDGLVSRNCKDDFFQRHKRRCSEKFFQFKVDSETADVRSSKTILQIVKHVHLELTEVCKEVTHVSSMKIATATMGTFFSLTGLLYGIYLHLVIHHGVSFHDGKLLILLMGVLHQASKFYIMNAVCSFTASEFEKARTIIHHLKIVTKDEELKNEIRQLSLQTMQTRLNFEPYGLFAMGYHLISSVASSVTTLLIILMQISTMKPQSK